MERFAKPDKSILAVAAIGISICLYLLLFDNGPSHRSSDEEALGTVQYQLNDTRQKPKKSYVWDSLRKNSEVHLGDSIYSGKKSQIQVQLKKGGTVDVGENSLVTFDLIEKEKVIDLEMGNFRLKVEGQMKIAMNGEIANIDGKNSDLQIFIGKDKKPKLKLLKGEAKVQKKETAFQLESRSIASLPAPEQVEVNEIPHLPPSNDPPNALPTNRILYTWKLYDLYEQIGMQLFEKKYRPSPIPAKALLNWQTQSTEATRIEWANNPDMKNQKTFESATGEFVLNQTYEDSNYWRVSHDGVAWSPVQDFTVTAGFVEEAEPRIPSAPARVPLIGRGVSLTLPLKTSVAAIGFVAQASTSESFSPENTRTFWSSKPEINLSFYRTGIFYYRFRTVTKDQELSRWSKPVVFDVFRPEAPRAPLLVQKNHEAVLGESIELAWKGNQSQTRIEILDEQNRIIQTGQGTKMSWYAPQTGKYKARAYASDLYGQLSAPSQTAEIAILTQQSVVAKTSESQIETPQRETASTDIPLPPSFEKIETSKLNTNYKSSYLAAQGLLWTIQSTDQKYINEAPPIAFGIGVNGKYWKDKHGFEGALKSGTMGINPTGREANALKDLELRYHYRLFTGFPMGLTDELQVSLFGGYQVYRNQGSYISNQYDLMKFGTSLEFPFAHAWSGGGELAFGLSSDKNTKYEISGHMNYYWDPRWSFGFGYRMHLFEAGSTRSSPSGLLPYREGYTEGILDMKYHF